MDVQPGSASASNLKIDQSESRKLSVFSNLTRKQSTAISAKKKRITKGEEETFSIKIMMFTPSMTPS